MTQLRQLVTDTCDALRAKKKTTGPIATASIPDEIDGLNVVEIEDGSAGTVYEPSGGKHKINYIAPVHNDTLAGVTILYEREVTSVKVAETGIVCADKTSIFKINKSNGTEIWRRTVKQSDGFVYGLDADENVYYYLNEYPYTGTKVDKSGTEIWSCPDLGLGLLTKISVNRKGVTALCSYYEISIVDTNGIKTKTLKDQSIKDIRINDENLVFLCGSSSVEYCKYRISDGSRQWAKYNLYDANERIAAYFNDGTSFLSYSKTMVGDDGNPIWSIPSTLTYYRAMNERIICCGELGRWSNHRALTLIDAKTGSQRTTRWPPYDARLVAVDDDDTVFIHAEEPYVGTICQLNEGLKCLWEHKSGLSIQGLQADQLGNIYAVSDKKILKLARNKKVSKIAHF